MRKVIGIGETILDIIFKNDQPVAAIPGGSVFNGIISLGRAGVDVSFISEAGNDKVGSMIRDFMIDSHVDTRYLSIFPDGKSPVSLAFLNDRNDAEYSFYKDYPKQRLDVTFPEIAENDILVMASYYVLNPVLRTKVSELLDYARERKAIIFYDLNFRSTHKHEAIKLTSTIIENLEYADIVRGSKDDFENLYGITDVDAIYKNKIRFYCPNFICTAGSESVSLRTATLTKEYPVEPLNVLSTVGAGDNFNAGVIYGLLKYGVLRNDLNNLSEKDWTMLINCGKDFSANACMNLGNSVSKEFAISYNQLNY